MYRADWPKHSTALIDIIILVDYTQIIAKVEGISAMPVIHIDVEGFPPLEYDEGQHLTAGAIVERIRDGYGLLHGFLRQGLLSFGVDYTLPPGIYTFMGFSPEGKLSINFILRTPALNPMSQCARFITPIINQFISHSICDKVLCFLCPTYL